MKNTMDGLGKSQDDIDEARTCQECHSNVSIYQCPGCNFRTCSLKCCKEHKRRLGCNGKRNRSTFLPLGQMNDNTIKNDYFFLEEVLNTIPRAKRTKIETSAASQPMSKKFRKLKKQAEKSGITLQIMPAIMTRHKNNSSWYSVPRDEITWKVEVSVYPTGASFSISVSENEQNLLETVLKHHKEKGHELFGQYSLFCRRGMANSKKPSYVHIGPEDSLKNILRGLTIVEYPTIYFVPEQYLSDFPTSVVGIAELATDDPEKTPNKNEIDSNQHDDGITANN